MVKNLPAMWEACVRSLGGEDPLEKEIATHSSTRAWAIPWAEERGWLQSMGSQRIKHNRVTIAHPHSLLQESFHPGLSLGSLLCFGHTGYASSSHDIIVKSSFASSGSSYFRSQHNCHFPELLFRSNSLCIILHSTLNFSSMLRG